MRKKLAPSAGIEDKSSHSAGPSNGQKCLAASGVRSKASLERNTPCVINQSNDYAMVKDAVNLHTIAQETDRYLESLAHSVREGKGCIEAANFARWLQFSGVIRLLERHEQDASLPVSGTAIRHKVQKLIFETGEWFSIHAPSNNPRDAYISSSKLDSIDDRLAAIESALADLQTNKTVMAGSVPLKLLEGA